jgi:hypothetical protein
MIFSAKKASPIGPASWFTTNCRGYFALGVGVIVGLTSLTLLLSSTFFTSGDAPGFAGEPVGDATGETEGDETGEATTTGVGVETGGFTSLFACGPQAMPKTVLAASAELKINDLLIVITSEIF